MESNAKKRNEKPRPGGVGGYVEGEHEGSFGTEFPAGNYISKTIQKKTPCQ